MIAEVTIVALVGLIAYQDLSNRKERRKLVEAVMAKNLTDLKQGESIEKKKSKIAAPAVVPIGTLDDEEFDKAIRQELGRETAKEKIKGKILRRKYGRP